MAVSPRFSWLHPQEWDAWVPGEARFSVRRHRQALLQSGSERSHTSPLVNLANLDMVILKTLPVLVGVQCALIMVFVCISLMIHNVEHLFCVYWPFCEVEGARVSALL